MKDIDCRIFEDQIDTLLDGTLSEEGLRQLRLHALACPACAAALEIHEHLARPSLAELEEEVPEHFLATLGSRVEDAIAREDGERAPPTFASPHRSRTFGRGWLLPSQFE